MVVITASAIRSKASTSGPPASRATGSPASPPAATDGWSGIWPIRGTPDVGGQAGAATRPEQRVRGAVLTGEVAHVLDDPGHPEVALPGHVGGAGRHLLGRHRGGGHDDHLGARQHPGQPHLDVAGARGHVDQQVVEVSPVDVLQELLDGPVQDEPPPHDGAVLVGQEPHGQDPQDAVPDAPLEGDHLLVPGLDLARASRAGGAPRIPRYRRPARPTVSPRRAMATARLTVTELLPTPPLPEAMAITRAVSGMSVAGAGSWASFRARAMTTFRCSASITPVVTATDVTPGSAPTWDSTSLCIWARSGQPATVRATSTSTRPSPPIRTRVHHAQFHDVGAQLGVDDAPERRPHVVLGRAGAGGAARLRPVGIGSVGPGHVGNSDRETRPATRPVYRPTAGRGYDGPEFVIQEEAR